MQRYAVGIEFSGVQYRGWQTQQPGVASVQETIERVLSKVAMNLSHFTVQVVQMREYTRQIWWPTSTHMPFVQKQGG